ALRAAAKQAARPPAKVTGAAPLPHRSFPMRTPFPGRTTLFVRLAGAALTLTIIGTVLAQGTGTHDGNGLIVLKDGTILEGQVKRDHTVEIDSYSHEAIVIPKTFFHVDDKARKVFFSPTQVRAADPKDPLKEEEFVWKLNKSIVNPRKLPDFLGVLRAD